MVEIHPTTWEVVALALSILVVKEKEQGSARVRGEPMSTPQFSPHARLPTYQPPQGQRDNAALQHSHSHVAHRNSPLATRRVHDAPSGSSNGTTQSENGLSLPATSYDDVPESMPTDDFAEEDLGSYDEDFDDTPALRKGKGKAKTSARARIESDEEGEYDDDGHVEDAATATARGPGWFFPYQVQNTAIKADPSFSILPLTPKRAGISAASPQRVSVHGTGLFSSRVKSGIIITAPQPVLSDEEQGETRPTKSLRKTPEVPDG